jgi:hypothetical protein
VKTIRFRIAWIIAFVALAALYFAAIRAFLGPHTDSLGHQKGILLLLGALPMANILGVGLLMGQRRPGSRRFLLGFEAFGAMALALFIALASFVPREVVRPYLAPFVAPLSRIIGPARPFVEIPIGGFVLVVLLGWPQVAFALSGGLLCSRFKITITPR